MTALALKTVPAYPLGRPVDGRPRYGMTPEQARIYRWLVKNRQHNGVFRMGFRDVAAGTGAGLRFVHECVQGLVERGWLHVVPNNSHTLYGFVHPIKRFKEPRHE